MDSLFPLQHLSIVENGVSDADRLLSGSVVEME
jgi:hypothetical protein